MKIDINEVKKGGYTLEEVLALIKLEATRIGYEFPYNRTEDNDYILLHKRGLVDTTANGHITSKSGQILIGKLTGVKKVKNVDKSELKFDEFWAAYPANDAFGQWMRTRALKSNKSGCETAYGTAIGNGVTHEELINALKWEVADRKSKSTVSNKMSFMKNSATWLNQREYEIILEENKNVDIETGDEDSWTTDMV